MREGGESRESVSAIDAAYAISLCSLHAGEALFGIDTATILEVLGKRALRRVPLAPGYIGGIVSYRGDMLTTISLRALLGLPALSGESCVMVLEDEASGDRFGLLVDSMGGVMLADRRTHAANPSTLHERWASLFEGLFRLPQGLAIQLTPRKLRPVVLGQNELLAATGHAGSLAVFDEGAR
jgi:purine-binding chemotaxis protein CheW